MDIFTLKRSNTCISETVGQWLLFYGVGYMLEYLDDYLLVEIANTCASVYGLCPKLSANSFHVLGARTHKVSVIFPAIDAHDSIWHNVIVTINEWNSSGCKTFPFPHPHILIKILIQFSSGN